MDADGNEPMDIRTADQFAAYCLTLLYPWDPITKQAAPLNSNGLTWVTLCDVMGRWRQPTATYVNQQRFLYFQRITSNMHVNSKAKRIVTMFRFQLAERLTGRGSTTQEDAGKRKNVDAEAAANEIATIRALAESNIGDSDPHYKMYVDKLTQLTNTWLAPPASGAITSAIQTAAHAQSALALNSNCALQNNMGPLPSLPAVIPFAEWNTKFGLAWAQTQKATLANRSVTPLPSAEPNIQHTQPLNATLSLAMHSNLTKDLCTMIRF